MVRFIARSQRRPEPETGAALGHPSQHRSSCYLKLYRSLFASGVNSVRSKLSLKQD